MGTRAFSLTSSLASAKFLFRVFALGVGRGREEGGVLNARKGHSAMQEAAPKVDLGALRHTKLTYISGSQPWLSRGLGLYSRDSAVSTAEELPEVDWGEPDEEVATGPSAAAATSLGELDRPATTAA